MNTNLDENDAFLWLESNGNNTQKFTTNEIYRITQYLGEDTLRTLSGALTKDDEPRASLVDLHVTEEWIYAFTKSRDSFSERLVRWPQGEPFKDSETILDLNALRIEEGVEWVYQRREHCSNGRSILLLLSRGGEDTGQVREIGQEGEPFVLNGLLRVAYLGNTDLVLFGCVGEGFDSGKESRLPKSVYLWDRSGPISRSEKIFEASAGSTSVNIWSTRYDRERYTFITESAQTGIRHYWVDDASLGITPLPFSPNTRPLEMSEGLLLFVPPSQGHEEEVWALDFGEFRTSSKVVTKRIFACSKRQSIQNAVVVDGKVYLHILEDVVSKVIVQVLGTDESYPLSLGLGSIRGLLPVPNQGVLFFYTDFKTPQILMRTDGTAAPSLSLGKDHLEAEVKQRWARSSDGTEIPYFVISSSKAPAPTIIEAYGGFGVPLTPRYLKKWLRLWVERGGNYIVANVRGGGEFGKTWHLAASKENRFRSFDDLLAVAHTSCVEGITYPGGIGLWGWSNGGLLVTNVALREPGLFAAVVSVAPLLDMKRYLTLSKSPYWKREYGDPDIPEELNYLTKMSPYHLINTNPSIPPTLFITATNDDRVHPAHSRKTVAKLHSLGNEKAFLYEYSSGGHGSSIGEVEEDALTLGFFEKHLRSLCFGGTGEPRMESRSGSLRRGKDWN